MKKELQTNKENKHRRKDTSNKWRRKWDTKEQEWKKEMKNNKTKINK